MPRRIDKKKLSFLFIFLLIILSGLVLYPYFYDIQWINRIIRNNGVLSSLIFVLLQVLQGITIFIPLTPVTIAGGIVFGSVSCVILSWIGVMISQVIAFNLSRSMGQEYMVRKFPEISKYFLSESFLSRIVKRLNPIAIMGVYLSGLVSFDILAYALGLTRISQLHMIIIASVGIIPKIVFLSYVGKQLNISNIYWLLLIAAALVIMVGLMSAMGKSKIGK